MSRFINHPERYQSKSDTVQYLRQVADKVETYADDMRFITRVELTFCSEADIANTEQKRREKSERAVKAKERRTQRRQRDRLIFEDSKIMSRKELAAKYGLSIGQVSIIARSWRWRYKRDE